MQRRQGDNKRLGYFLHRCYNWPVAKKGRRATEEDRIRAVHLIEERRSPELTAERLWVSRSPVVEWRKKYREGGLASLSTKFAWRGHMISAPLIL